MRLELFSDVCAWFCVHVNVPMCESKIICRSKSFIFQVPRLFATTLLLSVFTQDPKSRYLSNLWDFYLFVNLKLCPLLVKILQEPGTMWLLLFCHLCHTSLRMLSPLLCLFIKVVSVHELGIPLDHHLRPSFVVSLHSLGHSGGSEKSRLFLPIFLNFLLIYCIIIWSVVMRVSSWICTTPLPNFLCNRMGIAWDRGHVYYTKQNNDRTLP